MAINALQVAWISRLAGRNIIRKGDSILEFGPQDLLCSREVIEHFGLRHTDTETVQRTIEEAYEGDTPLPVLPKGFYQLFGIDRNRYRSLDLTDSRSDWLMDCNEPFKLPERFDVVTNFGTAEHVFNIAAVFRSIHDALKPGGVALHVLPTFGDINHGFYNIHPTVYLDLAAANNYEIDDICYVDRWDIRNRTLEENVAGDFNFDALPITMQDLTDRPRLQRKVVELYNVNYHDAKTGQYGPEFPGYVYDYCIVALRKKNDKPFRYPVQGYYGGGVAPISRPGFWLLTRVTRRLPASAPRVFAKAAYHRFVEPILPDALRDYFIRSTLRALLAVLVTDVTGRTIKTSMPDRMTSKIFKRVTYPPPPLDDVALERMMAIVEHRIERLYGSGKLNVTLANLDAEFMNEVKTLLATDKNFTAFIEKRYRERAAESPTRAKALDDLSALVRRP